MLPSLVAVRHAPVVERWIGVCYGALDVDVSMDHATAADRVLRRLARRVEWRPDQIWSSPLARCRDLAARIAADLSLSHDVDSRLAELDHGEFEGRRWEAIRAEDADALERWGEHWIDEGPPGGESARQLESRVRAWHDALDAGRAHLVIAHAGVVRALRVVRGLDQWPDAIHFPVPHLGWVPITAATGIRPLLGPG